MTDCFIYAKLTEDLFQRKVYLSPVPYEDFSQYDRQSGEETIARTSSNTDQAYLTRNEHKEKDIKKKDNLFLIEKIDKLPKENRVSSDENVCSTKNLFVRNGRHCNVFSIPNFFLTKYTNFVMRKCEKSAGNTIIPSIFKLPPIHTNKTRELKKRKIEPSRSSRDLTLSKYPVTSRRYINSYRKYAHDFLTLGNQLSRDERDVLLKNKPRTGGISTRLKPIYNKEFMISSYNFDSRSESMQGLAEIDELMDSTRQNSIRKCEMWLEKYFKGK